MSPNWQSRGGYASSSRNSRAVVFHKIHGVHRPSREEGNLDQDSVDALLRRKTLLENNDNDLLSMSRPPGQSLLAEGCRTTPRVSKKA